MKVEIEENSKRHFNIRIERLGLIGHIFDFRDGPFRLQYIGQWVNLTHAEHCAIQAAVEPKVKILNLTRRLTS